MFSVPHYRLVYHLKTDSDDVLLDTTEMLSGPLPLVDLQDSLGRKPESYFQDVFRPYRPMFHRLGYTEDDTDREVLHYSAIQPSDAVVQENILVSAMMDNPISPRTWEDEYILPAVSASEGNDLVAAM